MQPYAVTRTQMLPMLHDRKRCSHMPTFFLRGTRCNETSNCSLGCLNSKVENAKVQGYATHLVDHIRFEHLFVKKNSSYMDESLIHSATNANSITSRYAGSRIELCLCSTLPQLRKYDDEKMTPAVDCPVEERLKTTEHTPSVG